MLDSMDAPYYVKDVDRLLSPSLVLFLPLVRDNLDNMLRIAGSSERLRPHCKTHKMAEMVALKRKLGIDKHKCATLAEAEMLALCGVKDVVWAYPPVGPNLARVAQFRKRFPQVKLGVLVDHVGALQQLCEVMVAEGTDVEVLLDLDTGMHRTGCSLGEAALQIYQAMSQTPGVRAAGLHVYDGQNNQSDAVARARAVDAVWTDVLQLRKRLNALGCDVPQIVAGGTGSFPCFAAYDDPTLQLSPGTCVFSDVGYRDQFPDLKFQPAAVLLTRVVSRPERGRVTCDLGYKAVSSEMPLAGRVAFPQLPDAMPILQNEEHLVLQTAADSVVPGDVLWAIPRHVCPTVALHREAYVVEGGEVVGTWGVTARDRCLSI